MYGLLLDAFKTFIERKFGEESWHRVRAEVDSELISFDVRQIYGERRLSELAGALGRLHNRDFNSIMEDFGAFFLEYVMNNGYGAVIRVLGRDMRDFLNGLDNLHEYLRFSYPHMKAPTFIVSSEDSDGLTLEYRTRRDGFEHYVRGQIKAVAKHLYGLDVNVTVTRKDNGNGNTPYDRSLQENGITRSARSLQENGITCFSILVRFPNESFEERIRASFNPQIAGLAVPADKFFSIFPFAFAFRQDMQVFHAGESIRCLLPNLKGSHLTKAFVLTRPLVDFGWNAIKAHRNTSFQLTVERKFFEEANSKSSANKNNLSIPDELRVETGKMLTFKGIMQSIEEWQAIIFLCNPIVVDTDSLINHGIFVNDLSKHDSSRELVLAGNQAAAEIQLTLDREAYKTREMEKLIKRTDELLYAMIPKAIADKLRKVEGSQKRCEVCELHDSVTILFSDIVGFTIICDKIGPMQVVKLLNDLYTIFDEHSEKYDVYKVETIGDAYMLVSGAPNRTENHAWHVADMALDMICCVYAVPDPHTKNHLRIRVGCHSGSVVAGVVGLKMPRYCLFGDTVNTANRMESTGQEMRIHITSDMRALLPDSRYVVRERGNIDVKGKGVMKTFWLQGRLETRASCEVPPPGSPRPDPAGRDLTPSSTCRTPNGTPNGDSLPGTAKDQRLGSPKNNGANTAKRPSLASPSPRPQPSGAQLGVGASMALLPPIDPSEELQKSARSRTTRIRGFCSSVCSLL